MEGTNNKVILYIPLIISTLCIQLQCNAFLAL